MNTYLRVSILGFVAGLCALLTFVAVVYLALAVFGLAFTLVEELAQVRATGTPLGEPLWVLLGQSLGASGWNALRGLWDVRGGGLVFGALGLFAAWSHQVGLWVNPRRAWWISFISVAALLIVAAIVWLFVQQEQIVLWMAESPETYRWRDLLLGSQTAALTVGPIFALAFAYPTWTLWRWWYTRLSGGPWRDRAPLDPHATQVRLPSEDHRSYTTRLGALKRGQLPAGAIGAQALSTQLPAQDASPLATLLHSNRLLGLLVLLTIGTLTGYIVANRLHAQAAMRLQHGTVFVDATNQPHAEFPMHIAADVHRLRIVNINGLGVVALTLDPTTGAPPAEAQIPPWEFAWRSDEYLYQDMPVQELAPGDYLLQFDQISGWGYFEYMLSQGESQSSHLLALTVGLLLATTLLLAAALVALVLVRVLASRDGP